MKKIITLIVLITALGRIGVYSQTLENTIWTIDDPSGEFFAYYRFGADTISLSFDNITYHNIETYQLSGDTLTTVPLFNGDCLVTDTGIYIYSFQNDTVKITIISDPCIQRVTVLTTYIIMRYQTGIQSLNVFSAIKFYPNPASTIITISTPTTPNKNTILTIFNINGQVLLSRQSTEQESVVNVSRLPEGVYFVKVTDDRTMMVGKFVKQ
jgi:hypothetical protein